MQVRKRVVFVNRETERALDQRMWGDQSTMLLLHGMDSQTWYTQSWLRHQAENYSWACHKRAARSEGEERSARVWERLAQINYRWAAEIARGDEKVACCSWGTEARGAKAGAEERQASVCIFWPNTRMETWGAILKANCLSCQSRAIVSHFDFPTHRINWRQ